jgi:hypothetical protein
VHPELPVNKHLKYIRNAAIMAVLMGIGACFSYAQKPKPNLPDPVKFLKKYDIVANVVYAVLDEMDFKIELDDRTGGRIPTRPYEFITGALTASEVDKVAVRKDTLSNNWLKARYSVEALLEVVSPTETMVTIRTKMEALNQDFDGKEVWVPIQSLGVYERRILGKISMKINNNDEPANERKGFWGQRPQPVDSRQPRYPTAPSH